MIISRVLQAYRRRLPAVSLIVVSAVLLVSCESSLGVEYTLPGTWEGYIGLGQLTNQIAKGDLTMVITPQKAVTVSGSISGYSDIHGGDFVMVFEGSPVIRVQGDVYGQITMTRYRAGIDTTDVTVLFTGTFSDMSVSCFGDWGTVTGSAFSAAGTWTAVKD